MEKKMSYSSFNIELLRNKKSKIVSTEDALRDVVPIKWDKKVLSGEKEVLIECAN